MLEREQGLDISFLHSIPPQSSRSSPSLFNSLMKDVDLPSLSGTACGRVRSTSSGLELSLEVSDFEMFENNLPNCQ
jgi:hypothetical protein